MIEKEQSWPEKPTLLMLQEAEKKYPPEVKEKLAQEIKELIDNNKVVLAKTKEEILGLEKEIGNLSVILHSLTDGGGKKKLAIKDDELPEFIGADDIKLVMEKDFIVKTKEVLSKLKDLKKQLKEYPLILQYNIFRRRVDVFYQNNQELLKKLLVVNVERIKKQLLAGKTHFVQYDGPNNNQRESKLLNYDPARAEETMLMLFNNIFPNGIVKEIGKLDNKGRDQLEKFLQGETLKEFIEEESYRLYRISNPRSK